MSLTLVYARVVTLCIGLSMRIAVIGGSGFLGQRTVRALRAVPDVHVESVSRSSAVCVDLSRPETFDAVRNFDLLIDLSDGTRVMPDEFAAFCLREGLTLIEATSDAPTIDRLHARFREGPHRGSLVLGGGIFTGMSNLLGSAAARDAGSCERLTLGIASGPFSAAGSSTIALMVASLAEPALRVENDRVIQCAAVSRGPMLTFATGPSPSLRTRFAEVTMLHASTHAPTVDVFFAPQPSFLVSMFLALPQWLLRARLFSLFLGAYFTVLRRGLFRSISTRVQLVAEAQGTLGSSRRTLVAEDGMDAAAWALAAIAEQLIARFPLECRVLFVDELLAMDIIAARANALAGRTVMTVG